MAADNDPIRHAADLIRAGRREEARPILARHLQAEPDSVEGWMLMSMCISDRQRQIDCLHQVLRLQPDHSLAQSRLAKLTSSTGPVSTWSVTPEQVRPSAAPASPFTQVPPQPPPVTLRPSGETFPSAAMAETAAAPALAQDRPRPSPTPPDDAGKQRSVPAPEGGGASPLPKKGGSTLTPVLFVLLLLGLFCAAATIAAFLFNSSQQAQQQQAFAGAATIAAFTLPPTWTLTMTPTITLTPTPRPTATVTPTATVPIPNPTVLAEMDVIQREVADVRGLEPLEPAGPRYLLSKFQVRPVLEASFVSGGGTQEQLADLSRVWSALGLVKPTYDLYTNALNGLTDSVGGFYFPWNSELYVIGSGFSGIQRFVFSHEYGHALVDQHFDLDSLGVFPLCMGEEQRCQAIQALVEGDATLVMTQWWEQYASPDDYFDILNFNPPAQTLPEQFPPPFVLRDGNFPYVEGLSFVQALYARGRWARINQAYDQPPRTTEQIMHPSKYFAGEVGAVVGEIPLGDVLGAGWRPLENDALGEWMTYLLLGYGADVDSQLTDSEAAAAAAGWGGDRYQVYYNDETGQTVLAARWIWDSGPDALTFRSAMTKYLNERFGANVVASSRGACWEANAQRACLFSNGRETLWLLGPEASLLEAILTHFPGFN